jgi:hypothetical protein
MFSLPQNYFAFREGTSHRPALTDCDGVDYLFLGCCVRAVLYDFPTHSGRAVLLPKG